LNKQIKVAVIDLYNGIKNYGIPGIENILENGELASPFSPFEYAIFQTRNKNELPGLDYDIFISSGGPGSPWDGKGTKWETDYFSLLDSILSYNHNNDSKKFILFICHSFQLMARYFNLADVTKRETRSFGVVPIFKTNYGQKDFLLNNLPQPFYGADFRDWQVVNPNKKIFDELSAKVLCVESADKNLKHESSLTAIRVSNEFVGVQFHPEKDSACMLHYLNVPELKKFVYSEYGEEKYFEMMNLIDDHKGIMLTYRTIIPNFLKHAADELQQ
jgi:homoserine O-succinyltransferase/O-acetyltransferase